LSADDYITLVFQLHIVLFEGFRYSM